MVVVVGMVVVVVFVLVFFVVVIVPIIDDQLKRALSVVVFNQFNLALFPLFLFMNKNTL